MRFLVVASAVTALAAALACAPAAGGQPVSAPTVTATADDPFIWLEEPDAPRALDWVKAENARSLAILEKDPRYEPLHLAALKIVDAEDRIPTPTFRGGE